MSSSFDSIQRALDSLQGNDKVKAHIRFALDALHEWDHKHNRVLDTYIPFARESRLAEQRMSPPEDQPA